MKDNLINKNTKIIDSDTFEILFNWYKLNLDINDLWPIKIEYMACNKLNHAKIFDDEEYHYIKIVIESDKSKRYYIDNNEVFKEDLTFSIIGCDNYIDIRGSLYYNEDDIPKREREEIKRCFGK